jgi:hypothetical protein
MPGLKPWDNIKTDRRPPSLIPGLKPRQQGETDRRSPSLIPLLANNNITRTVRSVGRRILEPAHPVVSSLQVSVYIFGEG